MSTRMRMLVIATLIFLSSAAAIAQPDPTTERGIRPGLAYRVEGLDHVNLFNGTMTLNIPLGQSYPVNGLLSYSFMASYGTNSWDSGAHDYQYNTTDGIVHETRQYSYPSTSANAGFGWIVTLGRIEFPTTGGVTTGELTYVAPDGGRHEFSSSVLHPNDPNETPTAGVSYTTDGTYLRMKTFATEYRVEFPDGTAHRFDLSGRLFRMEDPFLNHVDIAYLKRFQVDPPSGNAALDNCTVWKITDSVGREHRVYFRPGWRTLEEWWKDDDPEPHKVDHELVDKVVLASFGSTTAQYTFNYVPETLPENVTYDTSGKPNVVHRTSRRCKAGKLDGFTPHYETVGILESIAMPHGASYSMVTSRGADPSACTFTVNGGHTGNLTRLVLPTGGRIDWTYQVYPLVYSSGPLSGGTSFNPGLATRVTRLENSDTSPPVHVTEYAVGKLDEGLMASDVYRLVTNKDGNGTVFNATKHYFSACQSQSNCTNAMPGEYGLPLTRAFPSEGGGFRSVDVLVPDANGNLVTKRRTYVRYEADVLLGAVQIWGSINQRPWYERTVYDDDSGRFAEVTHSDYDGLGHFRTSVTGGNFEKGNVRTTYTNYNPGAGTFALDANGNLLPGYNLPTGISWILHDYDIQRITEGTQTSESLSCFSSASGRLTSRRTYKNFGQSPTESGQDLLTVFTYDASGNRTTEQYFGGNVAAPSHTCGQTHSDETYRIENRYENGAPATSWYTNASGGPLSFYTTDTVIDQNTGLISKARGFRANPNGTDGLETIYTYDKLGRVTDAVSARMKVHYDYSLQPPKITTTERKSNNTLIRQSTTEFDGLGRNTLETRSMPESVTASRSTQYNGMGWKTQITEWGASAPTLFKYDAFGRATRIQAPDQSESDAATVSYTGLSSVTRTTKVRTSGSATSFTFSSAPTLEEYDRQGRLIRVTEPPQTVGGTRPITEYTYDAGSRLTIVCANKSGSTCGQTRTFSYDNRGLLTGESHPESGPVTYENHDARGHVGRRYLATGSFDLRFTYDEAERLTHVDEGLTATTTRPLKRFVFGTANSGSNLKNGQLETAMRWNWLPIGYTVQVAEDYTYTDPDGRPSTLTTLDYICELNVDCTPMRPVTRTHEFQQSFVYDELGATTTVNYPTCLTVCNGLSSRAVTNVYSNGFLKEVSWTGNTNSLTYHPSGMVKSVSHSNGVTDTQHVDPRVPTRPERIVTTNIEQAGCVAPAFTLQPQTTTITSGSVELQAAAVGETGSTITYTWYQGIAPDTSTQIGTGPSKVVTPTTTTSYWVRASNSCGTANSQTATVTVCAIPSIGTGPTNQSITLGQTKRLSASNITGSAPISYQWYVSNNGVDTPISGATADRIDVSPTTTTTYRLRATNSCGFDTDPAVVTVHQPPTVPANVVATYDAALGKVRVTWTASSSSAGIDAYVIERVRAGVVQTYTSTSTAWDDPTAVMGSAYFYRVRARDANDALSSWSTRDVASLRVFTDQVVDGSTQIKGVHVSELRQAIDAVRVAAGLGAAWTSYAPATGLVDDSHFSQMRDRLNDARQAFALDPVDFTQVVTPGWTVHRNHILELRAGVK